MKWPAVCTGPFRAFVLVLFLDGKGVAMSDRRTAFCLAVVAAILWAVPAIPAWGAEVLPEDLRAKLSEEQKAALDAALKGLSKDASTKGMPSRPGLRRALAEPEDLTRIEMPAEAGRPARIAKGRIAVIVLLEGLSQIAGLPVFYDSVASETYFRDKYAYIPQDMEATPASLKAILLSNGYLSRKITRDGFSWIEVLYTKAPGGRSGFDAGPVIDLEPKPDENFDPDECVTLMAPLRHLGSSEAFTALANVAGGFSKGGFQSVGLTRVEFANSLLIHTAYRDVALFRSLIRKLEDEAARWQRDLEKVGSAAAGAKDDASRLPTRMLRLRNRPADEVAQALIGLIQAIGGRGSVLSVRPPVEKDAIVVTGDPAAIEAVAKFIAWLDRKPPADPIPGDP